MLCSWARGVGALALYGAAAYVKYSARSELWAVSSTHPSRLSPSRSPRVCRSSSWARASTHARGLRRAERQSSDLLPDALLQLRSLAERDHRHQRNLLQYQQARHTRLPSPPALRVIRTAPATT